MPPIARKALGAACLALAVVLGSCAGYLATIPGPRGQHPHPDAAGTMLVSGIAAVVLLRVGFRLARTRSGSAPAPRSAGSHGAAATDPHGSGSTPRR